MGCCASRGEDHDGNSIRHFPHAGPFSNSSTTAAAHITVKLPAFADRASSSPKQAQANSTVHQAQNSDRGHNCRIAAGTAAQQAQQHSSNTQQAECGLHYSAAARKAKMCMDLERVMQADAHPPSLRGPATADLKSTECICISSASVKAPAAKRAVRQKGLKALCRMLRPRVRPIEKTAPAMSRPSSRVSVNMQDSSAVPHGQIPAESAIPASCHEQCSPCPSAAPAVCTAAGSINNRGRPVSQRLHALPRLPQSVMARAMMGRVLGQGSFGQVRHVLLEEGNAAMKIVEAPKSSVDCNARSQELLSIQREAQTLANPQLHHDNIVKALGYISETVRLGGCCRNFVTGLALELCKGGDLADVMESMPVSFKEGDLHAFEAFLRIALGLTSALAHLHSHHVMHADIKPMNILLAEPVPADQFKGLRPVAKLADFGTACRLDPRSGAVRRNEALGGSNGYMAPEVCRVMQQASSEPITAKADIWSLMITLHALWQGRHPFDDLDLSAPESDPTIELATSPVSMSAPQPPRAAWQADSLPDARCHPRVSSSSSSISSLSGSAGAHDEAVAAFIREAEANCAQSAQRPQKPQRTITEAVAELSSCIPPPGGNPCWDALCLEQGFMGELLRAGCHPDPHNRLTAAALRDSLDYKLQQIVKLPKNSHFSRRLAYGL
ncbi:hypothetical protein WJX74_008358 [Apatococcus lobatus]|uniref:Protein kinase domain-containing protein n=1 Tax=Apatococcus lobatus TaxID=904363 RepID=A0AAW1RF26_9CHLO